MLKNCCSKHAPARPGCCPNCVLNLHELHDESFPKSLDMDLDLAIFYCPNFKCNYFEPAWYLVDQKFLMSDRDWALKFGLDPNNIGNVLFATQFRDLLLRELVTRHKLMLREGDGR